MNTHVDMLNVIADFIFEYFSLKQIREKAKEESERTVRKFFYYYYYFYKLYNLLIILFSWIFFCQFLRY